MIPDTTPTVKSPRPLYVAMNEASQELDTLDRELKILARNMARRTIVHGLWRAFGKDCTWGRAADYVIRSANRDHIDRKPIDTSYAAIVMPHAVAVHYVVAGELGQLVAIYPWDHACVSPDVKPA